MGEQGGVAIQLEKSALHHASDMPQYPYLVQGQGPAKPLTLVLRMGETGHFVVPPPCEPWRTSVEAPIASKRLGAAVIPNPQKLILHPEKQPFVLRGAHIATRGDAGTLAVALLLEWLAAAGVTTASDDAANDVVFEDISNNDPMPLKHSEGWYELQVATRRVIIRSASPSGFVHAVATLRQLWETCSRTQTADGPLIPAVSVEDYPRFGHRGVMVDTARHYLPISDLKWLLNEMCLLKMNVLHWHLTDDEGWRLEVPTLPNLTRVGAWRGLAESIEPQLSGPTLERYGGSYSREDIADLKSYAAARCITIVPEIDVPGHAYAAKRSLPELLEEADASKGPSSAQNFQSNVLNPGLPGTLEFLAEVLTEVVTDFDNAPMIHIGGDEIPQGAWRLSAVARRAIRGEQASHEPLSSEEEAELRRSFFDWMHKWLASKGVTHVAAWEEAFYDGWGPAGAIAYAWKPQGPAFAAQALRRGLDVVLCPADFLYLDTVESEDFQARGLYWSAVSLPLERVYEYEPMDGLSFVESSASSVELGRVRGIQANLWGETVSCRERMEEMLFPRLLAVAEVAWSEQHRRSWKDFSSRRLPSILQTLQRRGIRLGSGEK
eukprot:TRINITY_DN11234_c0_g1_i2.p1 TRINITY_DN11234_c0_g1~~TRINITY_DN11234_c0_g1_i2.p1  ORF type:complete len:646 (-),score=55.85 TRINITY_DN11234_c0_g1_i2:966-2786(-)